MKGFSLLVVACNCVVVAYSDSIKPYNRIKRSHSSVIVPAFSKYDEKESNDLSGEFALPPDLSLSMPFGPESPTGSPSGQKHTTSIPPTATRNDDTNDNSPPSPSDQTISGNPNAVSPSSPMPNSPSQPIVPTTAMTVTPSNFLTPQPTNNKIDHSSPPSIRMIPSISSVPTDTPSQTSRPTVTPYPTATIAPTWSPTNASAPSEVINNDKATIVPAFQPMVKPSTSSDDNGNTPTSPTNTIRCNDLTKDLSALATADLSISFEVDTSYSNTSPFLDKLISALLAALNHDFSLCLPSSRGRRLLLEQSYERRLQKETVMKRAEILDASVNTDELCTPEEQDNFCRVADVSIKSYYNGSEASATFVNELVYRSINKSIEEDALFNGKNPPGDIVDVRIRQQGDTTSNPTPDEENPNQQVPPTNIVDKSGKTKVGLTVALSAGVPVVFILLLVFVALCRRRQKDNQLKDQARKALSDDDDDKLSASGSHHGSEDLTKSITCPSPSSTNKFNSPSSQPSTPSSAIVSGADDDISQLSGTNFSPEKNAYI